MSQVYSEQELYHLYNKFGASARSLAAYASDPECYESHVTQEITAITGCIEGFSGTENCIGNAMKITNSITKFCILKSVIEVKVFWES